MLNRPALSRRTFSVSLASLFPLALGFRPASAAQDTGGISRNAESIHQEVVIKATRKQVYDVLTDTDKFRKLSGGMDTKISREPGGSFSLFGGVITGRHIEMVPGERLVQAWRSQWAPGEFSIVRFVLKDEGANTRIVFDHTGFPKGTAEHLASGWKEHYWDGLTQYFAA